MNRFTLFGASVCTIALATGCQIQRNTTDISGTVVDAPTEYSAAMTDPVATEDALLFLSSDSEYFTDGEFHGKRTDEDGGYDFKRLPDGTYIVSPFSETYKFEPSSRTILAVRNDLDGLNFIRYQHTLWYADSDNDGYGDPAAYIDTNDSPVNFVSNKLDCDDSNKAIRPDAAEQIDDGIDQNCDGLDRATWFEDSDADGFGNPASNLVADTQPMGFVANNGDCDDNDKYSYPEAKEITGDGKDQSCDGVELYYWYLDADADGFGDKTEKDIAATQPVDHVNNGDDCNDDDSAINPDASEINFDGIDQNCNGVDVNVWYADRDNDGFGSINDQKNAELAPTGYVSNAGDCDDTTSALNPNAIEIPGDNIDQNCDGFDTVTWNLDSDSDGFGDPAIALDASAQPKGYVLNNTDCDDSRANIHPGATEIPGDMIDQDCDSKDSLEWFADTDADGFGDISAVAIVNTKASFKGYSLTNDDCDDTNKRIHPGASEISVDGIDQDCNGIDSLNWYIDADADGFGHKNQFIESETAIAGYAPNALDCNDTSDAINPSITEIQNDGIDQDCDGYDLSTWYRDIDGDGFGDSDKTITLEAPAANYSKQDSDCDDTNASRYPNAPEIDGDAIDSDCNGSDD